MSVPPFLTLPPGVTGHDVDLRDARLATLQAGPTDATARALLVAGFTGSKEDFIALLPLLAQAGVHAVSYDQLGQYQSTTTADEARFTIEALAADVINLSRTTWPHGPRPHLVGHSLGGLVSRLAVLEAPSDFASLTLLASGPKAVPEHQRPPLELLRQVLPEADLAAVWEVKRALDESRGIPQAPEPISEFLRVRWITSSPHGLRAEAGILLTEVDRVDLLADTGTPTLVVFGSNDDVWFPADQRAMAERLGAATITVPDVGHSPATEAPEVTAAALIEFWSAPRTAGA